MIQENDSPIDRGNQVLHWSMSSGRRLGESSVASRKRPLNGSMGLPPVMGRLRFLVSVFSPFLLTAVAAAQIGHAMPVALQSCSVPGVGRSARCGAIEVLENPDRPGSRNLEIHFVVIPAVKGHARPDPIVPLLGGPGEAAIETGQMFLERLAPMLNDRDLLLVDQRGTGQSGALRCHFFSPDDLFQCPSTNSSNPSASSNSFSR